MEKVKVTTVNQYLKKQYGCKVYKISIDGGFTCPNRDGSIGTGGCIFCSLGGSGEFSQSRSLSITEQLRLGKEFIAKKLPKGEVKYIAYFQAFTNTYGPVEKLREKYSEALKDPEVVVISIATRPDCLSEEVLGLLDEINHIKQVWVELGLQTANEATAEYIRRGYSLNVYDAAVKNLKALNITVVTHVILGLPGESKEDMLNTVKHICHIQSDGIKLQLLHVLKGTDLEKEYAKGKFKTLEMDEYFDILTDCLKLLPKDMIVHRMTGDGDKKQLIAPMWSADKKRVINTLSRYIDTGE